MSDCDQRCRQLAREQGEISAKLTTLQRSVGALYKIARRLDNALRGDGETKGVLMRLHDLEAEARRLQDEARANARFRRWAWGIILAGLLQLVVRLIFFWVAS